MIPCTICDEPVEARPPNYRLVVGWEQVRRGGGANRVARRAETGRWAHRDCVELPNRDAVLFDLDDVPPGLLGRPAP